MRRPYFTFRDPFDFHPHKYDIGRPISHNREHEDAFFVLKIYEIRESEYGYFYYYQLGHYISRNPEGELAFFSHVCEIVISQIKLFKEPELSSKAYRAGLEPTEKLEAFVEFLTSIDRWNKTRPLEAVISEKDNFIGKLNDRIAQLETRLKETARYDSGEKIVISKGGIAPFMDLIHQMQELTLPGGNKLTRSQAQSPWYKMIARYFQHGEKEISIDTARNYFPARKEDQPAKFIQIVDEDKLFKIIPKNDI